MDESFNEVSLDAPWYEASYPDVGLSGLTAADHYRLIGRHLGRPSRPEKPQGQLAEIVRKLAVGAATEAKPAAKATVLGLPIVDAPKDLSAVRSPARGGVAPRPALAGLERDLESLGKLWPLLSLFARLHGQNAREMFQLPDPPPEASRNALEVVGPVLRDGVSRIGDLWFASATTLCLRVDRADDHRDVGALYLYQLDPKAGGALRRVGGQSLAPRGPSFMEATLRNPLMPVLVELTDASGATRDLALLAFPSLARGGLHGAELVGLFDGQTTTDALWSYTEARLSDLLNPAAQGRLSRILVSLGGAGGGEHIFSRAVSEWLALFGLVAEPVPTAMPGEWERLGAAEPARREPARQDGPALILPCDFLPTIAALTEPALPNPGKTCQAVAPFFVADLANNRPRWTVTLPASHADLSDLQPAEGMTPVLLGTEGSTSTDLAVLPLAIRYRDPRPVNVLRALLPTMPANPLGSAALVPARGHVLCVLDVSEARAARVALTALSKQQGSEGTRLALTGEATAIDELEPELASIFNGPVERLGGTPPLSSLLAAAGGADSIFFLEDRVILHDPRTLALLRLLLARGRTASAACVTLHESMRGNAPVVATESGGYFPTRVGLLGGPHLLFEQVDTAQALPSATYPVVANALSATLVAKPALEEAAQRFRANRPLDDLTFGLVTQALGWRHLCTSTVRVVSLRPRTKGERVDPVALRRIAPARWEDLLSEVTLLGELR